MKAYKTSRHAEKCMNSTGRWVHGLTKLDTDCNHRNTAWNERLASTELFRTLKWNRPVVEEKKKKVCKFVNKPTLVWFPDSSPGFGQKKTIKKKERRVFFLFRLFFWWWWKRYPSSVCYTTTRFLMFVQKRHPGEGFGAVLALVFFHIRMGL